MTQLDRPHNQIQFEVINGVRHFKTHLGDVVPIYYIELYIAIGILPEDTIIPELTEEELVAQASAEEFQTNRNALKAYIREFEPKSYDEIEELIHELSPHLVTFHIDAGEVRQDLRDKLGGLASYVLQTNDPEYYIIYASTGHAVVWTGEGEPPELGEES